MEDMEVELLILIKNDDSFCNNVKAFESFLNVDSHITVAQNKITLALNSKKEKSITASFKIETGEIESKKERYFLVSLRKDDRSPIENFNDLILKIKDIANRINPDNSVINVVWDDVGRHYATEAYPVLNNVENLMRKLISKFLLINVGMNWSKETMVPDLLKKIANYDGDNDHYVNDMFKIDFIHLSDFLFEKKRDISITEVDRILAKGTFDEKNIQSLSNYLPKSNWEKYFSSLIDQNQNELEANWKRLYKLRNKVAHNRFLTKNELSETISVASKVEGVLEKAIGKLTDISLDDRQRSLIIEEYNSNQINDKQNIFEAVADFYRRANFEVVPVHNNIVDFVAFHGDARVNVHIIQIPLGLKPELIKQAVLRTASASLSYSQDKKAVACIIHLILPNKIPEKSLELLIREVQNLGNEIELQIQIQIGFVNNLGQFITLVEGQENNEI